MADPPAGNARRLDVTSRRLDELFTRYMAETGLTLQQIGARLVPPVTAKTIANWMQGIHPPKGNRLRSLLALFKPLGVNSPADLKADPTPEAAPAGGPRVPPPRDDALDELTYYRYRTLPVPAVESPAVALNLAARYGRTPFELAGRPLPAVALWRNADAIIDPDAVLGPLDRSRYDPMTRSPVLGPADYGRAREYIRAQCETGPITSEGLNYRMTRIDGLPGRPVIHGTFGWYYDNILTQYALEWELKKALVGRGAAGVGELDRPGMLPLREAVERDARGDPVVAANSRCAAITVSTLLVFDRPHVGLTCLVRRRSLRVAVSPGMYHVIPAAMFEAPDRHYPRWSVRLNVWRELLEEVYGEEEQQRSGVARFPEYAEKKPPVDLLLTMLEDGSAAFSVTGVCCDLLNLRPEICTVLVARDPRFFMAREMKVNWEYQEESVTGTLALPWAEVDRFIADVGENGGMVVSGAVCLGLGREWVRNLYGV